LASVKSRLESVTADGRMQLARAVSSLAAADGNIASAEVKLLEQIYRALELDPQTLYSHLNDGGLASSSSLGSGSKTAVFSEYTLNTARLAALREETDRVSALLNEVFADEETRDSGARPTENPASPVTALSDENLLPGLDAIHRRFLAEILQKPSWSRPELQATATRMQVMLDGALERINEAAFEFIGEPITEGDDPICVQQTILENAH
jgi:hypothetical protein